MGRLCSVSAGPSSCIQSQIINTWPVEGGRGACASIRLTGTPPQPISIADCARIGVAKLLKCHPGQRGVAAGGAIYHCRPSRAKALIGSQPNGRARNSRLPSGTCAALGTSQLAHPAVSGAAPRGLRTPAGWHMRWLCSDDGEHGYDD